MAAGTDPRATAAGLSKSSGGEDYSLETLMEAFDPVPQKHLAQRRPSGEQQPPKFNKSADPPNRPGAQSSRNGGASGGTQFRRLFRNTQQSQRPSSAQLDSISKPQTSIRSWDTNTRFQPSRQPPPESSQTSPFDWKPSWSSSWKPIGGNEGQGKQLDFPGSQNKRKRSQSSTPSNQPTPFDWQPSWSPSSKPLADGKGQGRPLDSPSPRDSQKRSQSPPPLAQSLSFDGKAASGNQGKHKLFHRPGSQINAGLSQPPTFVHDGKDGITVRQNVKSLDGSGLKEATWGNLTRKPQEKPFSAPSSSPPQGKARVLDDVWSAMDSPGLVTGKTKSRGGDLQEHLEGHPDKAGESEEPVLPNEMLSHEESLLKQSKPLKALEEDSEVEVDGIKVVFDSPANASRAQGKPKEREIAREEQLSRGPKSAKKGKRGGLRHDQGYRSEEDERYSHDDDLETIRQERRRRKEEKKAAKLAKAKDLQIPEYISLANLAEALRVKQEDLLMQLVEWGFDDITEDSIMTGETAGLVAQEYGFEPKIEIGDSQDLKARIVPSDTSSWPPRPPVVTIMGHVDHGKTTILDYLRKSSIAAQEHGGITQHIGAFSVRLSSGQVISFLDTPGHAAFLAMRQRGANVTDIVILVVAADDSVMPQTHEALKHARSAKVPILVAINKIDKLEADVGKVKKDLGEAGIEIEEYGGDVQVVPVSAKTGQGMDDLEENLMLLAEVLDLRGDPSGMVEGWILESSLKPVGKSATVLVKRGTMHVGDIIVAGTTLAKIRSLRNEAGKSIKEAGPGTPVEILGWRDMPRAGDEVIQAPDQQTARMAIQYRENLQIRSEESAEAPKQQRQKEEAKRKREADKAAKQAREEAGITETLEEARRRIKEEEEAAEASGMKLVNFIIRADVAGSVEAVEAAVQEIGNHEIQSQVLRSSVGPPTLADVEHAAVSNATIVSFNNEVPGSVQLAADKAYVRVIDHSIIYHLSDEVKELVQSNLPPRRMEKTIGEAEVLKIFRVNIIRRVFRNIAGARVNTGIIRIGQGARVMRNGEKVFDGKLMRRNNSGTMRKAHSLNNDIFFANRKS